MRRNMKGCKKDLKKGMERGIERGMEKGMKKGIQRGIVQMAVKMLENGIDRHTVAAITGLSEQELAALKTAAAGGCDA